MENLESQTRSNPIINWLLTSTEPWTRYRTLRDLLERPEDDPQVSRARSDILADPRVIGLLSTSKGVENTPFKRHNDAGHPLFQLGVLADFGLSVADPSMAPLLHGLLSRQSGQGAFQSLELIPVAYGGSGQPDWAWMACDAPVVLSILIQCGLGADPRVQKAAGHLADLSEENGWRCAVSPELGKFHGPGRRSDPCPIANLLALRALSYMSGVADSAAVHNGIEMLLGHWEHRTENKYYLFGIGSDFQRIKYPLIWYDLLNATDVLSRFSLAREDPRFIEMLAALSKLGNQEGLFTASSIYQAWKGWSFNDKKNPSPWLTFLVHRILKRSGQNLSNFEH